jgi:hypothetical protein
VLLFDAAALADGWASATRKANDMTRSLIAAIAALSLALGGVTATPARADNSELGRVLAGIALIAIIGAAINEGNRPQAEPAPQPPYGYPPMRYRALPTACIESFDTRYGEERLFMRRCLERNYRYAAWLPQECLTSVRTRHGYREGYEPRCLRRAGFRWDAR